MPRRKNFSHKFRRAQLLDARAVKRGELTLEEAATAHQERRTTRAIEKTSKSAFATNAATHEAVVKSKRGLQSRFLGLSDDYLDLTRDLSFSIKVPRPLPGSSALFPIELLTERDIDRRLTCPTRPRYRVGQSKKELERNEEGVFGKWLKGAEDIMKEWLNGADQEEDREEDVEDDKGVEESPPKWPRGPSWFETNLEVWRQLWRVTESSSIILLLLDARCPPLHSPPSLKTYLQNLKPHKEIILVLTKSDLVDPIALEGWKSWVKDWWGIEGIQVVSVMSYEVELLSGKGRHRPDIPQESLDELLTAIKQAHGRLLTPPIINDDKKQAFWRPTVRKTVDWGLLARHSDFDPSVQEDHDTPEHPEVSSDSKRDPEKEPLTIGLVGQPNVGKSSLLNALLGEQRVRASRTPGKTKHFQTMFWGWKKEVKIVDCPGLVCPSLVGVELQVLAGILPISQIPSLPACIHLSAHHLPLETIFSIPPPDLDVEDEYESKKTYRDPLRALELREKKRNEWGWTAGGLMEARAVDRGFVTAKGGRPDTNRAANGMMRQLADGKVKWGFWPPGSDVTSRDGLGIWLGTAPTEDIDDVEDDGHPGVKKGISDGGSDYLEGEYNSEGSEHLTGEEIGDEGEEDDEEGEDDEDGGNDFAKSNVRGFFAALSMKDGEECEDEDEDDSEVEESENEG